MLVEKDRIKIMAKDTKTIDQAIEALKSVFDCNPTSPKMFANEKNLFFQFIEVEPKGGA